MPIPAAVETTRAPQGPSSPNVAEPDGAPRLPVLDVLRGVAILAILFLNIPDMGASAFAGVVGDPRRLGWGVADQAIWWTSEVGIGGTARGMLEMLFGVGMVILTDRITAWAYAWRNLVLFAFGLVHVFVLLWPGDILHSYALAALVSMPLRHLRPRALLTIGLSFALVTLVAGGLATAYEAQHRAEVATARTAPAAAAERALALELARETAREDRDRTDTAASWAAAAWRYFGWAQAQGVELIVVWEAAGAMLIGAALYRWGIIQGARSRRFYVRLTAWSYLAGLSCRIAAAFVMTGFDGAPNPFDATYELARLLTTLGHVGAINLLLTGAGAWALRPFAAAGRTALSIYILQTLICLWVIYPPWGLALYGRQGWVGLMATALAVDVGLLAWAVWWDRRFAIAPVEWAWRSVVAGRRLAFIRRTR